MSTTKVTPDVLDATGTWSAMLAAATGGTPRSLASHFSDTLNVLDFPNITGDGSADDTAGLLAAFTYIKANGVQLLDTRGLIFKTAAISLTGAAKAFAFRGVRGVTKFVRKDDTVDSMFTSTSSSVPFELHNFIVDCKHATFTNGNHGFSIADMNGLRMSGIDVVDYKNTAILVYGTVVDTYADNWVIDSSAYSAATTANNGMLMSNLMRSGFVRCVARGALGSPGYGIQLKNKSVYCAVTDCYAQSCVAGLAFGQDTGLSAVKYSTVQGFKTLGCTTGFVAGFAERNHVSGLIIDMSSANLEAIDLNTTNIGNYISATVLNVAAAKNCVRVRTGCTDNTVILQNVDNLNTTGKCVAFDSGSLRNTVRVERITNPTIPATGPQGLVTDNSTGNDNSFEYPPYPNYFSATIATGVVTVKNPLTTSVLIDTEAAAAADDVDTITGQAYEGKVLILSSANSARDPTIKHNTGNILLVGGVDFVLTDVADNIVLRYNSTSSKWMEVSRANVV